MIAPVQNNGQPPGPDFRAGGRNNPTDFTGVIIFPLLVSPDLRGDQAGGDTIVSR